MDLRRREPERIRGRCAAVAPVRQEPQRRDQTVEHTQDGSPHEGVPVRIARPVAIAIRADEGSGVRRRLRDRHREPSCPRLAVEGEPVAERLRADRPACAVPRTHGQRLPAPGAGPPPRNPRRVVDDAFAVGRDRPRNRGVHRRLPVRRVVREAGLLRGGRGHPLQAPEPEGHLLRHGQGGGGVGRGDEQRVAARHGLPLVREQGAARLPADDQGGRQHGRDRAV